MRERRRARGRAVSSKEKQPRFPSSFFLPCPFLFLRNTPFSNDAMSLCTGQHESDREWDRERGRARERKGEKRGGDTESERNSERKKSRYLDGKKIIWQRRGVFYFILFIASRVSGRGFCAFRSTQSIFCGILAAPLCLGLGLDTFFYILRPGGRISVWDTCQNVIWRRKGAFFLSSYLGFSDMPVHRGVLNSESLVVCRSQSVFLGI